MARSVPARLDVGDCIARQVCWAADSEQAQSRVAWAPAVPRDRCDLDYTVVALPGVAVISSLPADALLPIVRTSSEVGVDEGGCSPTRARARCACRSSRIRPAASAPATPAIAATEGRRRGRSQRRTVEGVEMRALATSRCHVQRRVETPLRAPASMLSWYGLGDCRCLREGSRAALARGRDHGCSEVGGTLRSGCVQLLHERCRDLWCSINA